MRVLFETEKIGDEDKFLSDMMGLAKLGKKPVGYYRTVRKNRKISMSKRRNELRHSMENKIQGVNTYFGYVKLPKDFFSPDNG